MQAYFREGRGLKVGGSLEQAGEVKQGDILEKAHDLKWGEIV